MQTTFSFRQIAGGAFNFFLAGVFLAALGMTVGLSIIPESDARRLDGTIGCGFGELSEHKCGTEIPLIADGDTVVTVFAAADMDRLGTPEAGDQVEVLARQKNGVLIAEALRLRSRGEMEAYAPLEVSAFVYADNSGLIDL